MGTWSCSSICGAVNEDKSTAAVSPLTAAADTFQAHTARKSDRDASVLLRRDTMMAACVRVELGMVEGV